MLALFLLWIVVYLSGRLLCKIGGEKEASQLWIHLTGFFFLFLSQGIIFFLGQVLGESFLGCVRILEYLYLAVALTSIISCKKEVGSDLTKLKTRKQVPYGRHLMLLVWLLVALFWVILIQWEGNRADAMVETAGITLLTDTMNQYHPFTHEPFQLGVIFTRKLITLPFWYAALSHWTGFSVAFCVTAIGNMFSLLFMLCVITELGNLLFERNQHHTYWLIIFMELLYLSGDYDMGSEGYRQLYYGYSGEVMVTAIVIPYVILLLYRVLGKGFRDNFQREGYGIKGWVALLRLCMAIGTSVFLSNLKWGLTMLLISIGVFALMTFIVVTMKKMMAKGEKA